MSSNLLDLAFTWIGTGAGLPKFCVPFLSPPTRMRVFGAPDGAGVHDSLLLQPAAGAELHVPMNGMLWQVPALGTGALPADVLPAWPRLKRIDGSAFDPRISPAAFAQFDLLLEVWPAAFRRLEYIVSSLDIPTGVTDWALPQMPVARWFWIRGVGALGQRAQDIANAQFTGSLANPDLTGFVQGKVPLYVPAGKLLTVSDGDVPIEIRAFDALGGVVDPDWVFATIDLLSTDSDFTHLRCAEGEGASPWNAPERHVLLFCDAAGRPYVSRADPDAPSQPPPTAPARQLTLPGTSAPPLPIPDHGLVVIDATDEAYGALADQLAQLELPGQHQRLTLLPHGTLAKRPRASFGRHSFFRVQVVDFARWFSKSANPRNDAAGDDALKRYTDGNEIVPLIDGRDMLREVYRALRATHAVETYASDDHVPALDPDAAIGVPDVALAAKAKILLTNAWIDADTALLGRRALMAAPRTQSEPPPSFDDVRAGFVVVGALPPGRLEDPAAPTAGLPEHRLWWLMSRTPLPPGCYVDLRQLTIIDWAHGDDPRLPGVELTSDIYGVLGPLGDQSATGAGFAGTTGRFVLPVLYKNGEVPRAHLRLVTWEPDADDPAPASTATSGKGKKTIRASGEIELPVPEPADREAQPVFDRPGVSPQPEMRLEFDGTPGRAIVVIAPSMLFGATAVPVVIMNARSGEIVAQMLGPNIDTELRIPIGHFGLRDWVLVGFGPGSSLDPADVGVFFMLRATPAQMQAGAAIGHPTQIIGALQEAMIAGVDTRLLAWHATDQPPEKRLYSATGMVAAVNAGVNDSRGQSIFDALTRRELGVHHQKGAFIRTARPVADGGGAMAFVGGIDLLSTRWDTHAHAAIEPDRQHGPWHDVHCRIRGRAVWDVYRNIRQRWNAALEHPELSGHDPGWTALPAISDVTVFGPDVEEDGAVTLQGGDCTVQINRTLSPHLSAYDGFLDNAFGDLSIQKAYRRVIDEARQFLYIEDQYFWDRDLARRIHDALFQKRLAFVIMLLPKRLNEVPMGDLVLYAQRRRSMSTLLYGIPEVPAGTDPATLPENVSDRVVLFTIRNDFAEPVYVHCKTFVADDLWLSISSSNMSRRSMTYDSEIGAMSIDGRTRRGGQRTAREVRVAADGRASRARARGTLARRGSP